MKQVVVTNKQTRGERSESSRSQTLRIPVCALRTSFTPVTPNKVFTLLLSTFTPTHAYARAYPRKRVCVRGVVKEERSVAALAATCRRRSPRCRALATRSPLRTERDTWPHGGPRPVCHSGRALGGQWFLPGGKARKRDAGTAAVLERVCFDCPDFFLIGGFACPPR